MVPVVTGSSCPTDASLNIGFKMTLDFRAVIGKWAARDFGYGCGQSYDVGIAS
ncbi:MAG: hypothetical protein NVS1B6_05650 [Steroidobacteraceae bacterium]